MSINWPTTSQGPKKKSIKFTKRRIDPCPAHTARNKGSFTTMVLWNVNPLFPQLYVIKFWTGPKTIILGAGHTQLLISVKHIKTIILGAGYTQLLISVKHICSCVRPALKTFE